MKRSRRRIFEYVGHQATQSEAFALRALKKTFFFTLSFFATVVAKRKPSQRRFLKVENAGNAPFARKDIARSRK